MTKDQISKIEKVLNIKFHEEYIDIMTDYPFNDKKLYPIIQDYLINEPDQLIELNTRLREKGITEKKKWPNHLIVIGKLRESNFYFMNVEELDNSVYVVDVESRINLKNLKKMRISSNLKLFIIFCKGIQKAANIK